MDKNNVIQVGKSYRITIPQSMREKASLYEGDYAVIDVRKIQMEVQE